MELDQEDSCRSDLGTGSLNPDQATGSLLLFETRDSMSYLVTWWSDMDALEFGFKSIATSFWTSDV